MDKVIAMKVRAVAILTIFILGVQQKGGSSWARWVDYGKMVVMLAGKQ